MAFRSAALLALCCASVLAADPPALVPDGLDGAAIDHLHSASEPLLAACKAAGVEDATLAQGLRYAVTRLDGTPMAAGVSTRWTRSGGRAVYRLLDPAQAAAWDEGWYDLRTEPAAGGRSLSTKFRHIARPGATPVVYLLDNLSPEGWAEFLNQGFAAAIEPLRAFPAGAGPRLVVMSHWAQPDAAVVERLEAFVTAGGTLLLFGDNHAALDRLSPLRSEGASPYQFEPQTVTVAASAGLDLASWQGLRSELVTCQPAAGAQVLASAGALPFLAERRLGAGRVLACAAPLKPGPAYAALVRGLLAIPAPAAPAAAAPDAAGWQEGISGNRNVGRFGWLDNDRVNEMGMQRDRAFRMWDVHADTFRVDFPPFTDSGPGTLRCVQADWLGKHLVGSGGVFGAGTELYYGLGTPGVLFRNPQADRLRLHLINSQRLAYPVAGGARTLRAGADGEALAFDPAAMDRNWLLFWQGGAGVAGEWPLLVCLNRRLAGIRRIDANTWELAFAQSGLDVAAMPLEGVRHLDPQAVAGWDPPPAAVVAQADRWARAQGRRTIACREDWRPAPGGGAVEIRDTYSYLDLANDWGIAGEAIAPVPPLLPLAIAAGTASAVTPLTDTGVATFHGPLHAAAGSSVTYRLPLPDLRYPLATRAVPAPADDPLRQALLERICAHAALPNNVCLPVYFMPVDMPKEAIHPDGDLVPATFAKATQEVRGMPFIDLHRNLGGTWGLVELQPYLAGLAGHQEVKDLMAAKIARNLRRDVSFFQYKTLLRWRTEPNAGGSYPITFLGPVRWNDGYRIFHDQNETVAIVLYACEAWAETTGDDAFLAANRPYLEANARYLTTLNDWAWMSSMAVEWGMGNNIDMLNSELPAWAALQRIRARLGDRAGAGFAGYMAAKAAVSASARFHFGPYYNGLRFPDLLKLSAETHEMAAMGQTAAKGGRFLPYGVANGYGEGWPSLWPNDLGASYLTHNLVGIDIYNHSKGVCAELLEAYRFPAVLAVLTRFEQAFIAASRAKGWPISYSRIACLGALTGDLAGARAELQRSLAHPGLTAKVLGAGTADWEIPSMVMLLDLLGRGGASTAAPAR
ncbi:MAG: hypothetical protein L6R48_04635 [Planctomycetes bacterium]|nr:hypothetical protein [Planctomycetota bacterium]